ncbi:phosphatase PAP2 family protein [Nocardioides sp. CFH 31398]|uniref:phosphatase PAP2 family protein n=1 Tax=Nocardioides sp. CFH 31398 TaxID=2919579 RepID=UPI001F060688|nr:phosphatase PAP2 family protein [Nocardioides sp. CFH 31398]MCH1866153.1 phosphatase PAP2 family protein [Nocardioides sp. CFH 31398]
MYRRAYALLVGVTVGMLALALVTAHHLDRSFVDPEGFLGPAWARGPLLILGALALDMVPRALWYSRLDPRKMWPIVTERWRTHWTRDRIVLVVLGVTSFYVTYVAYRNLKSFLPEVLGRDYMFDRELHQIDQFLFFGNEPAVVLHSLLGYEWIAQLLSSVYLWYLPLVPLAVTGWAIWSRNISFGYWFATSQVLAWTLGTASYYMLPTLGPGFEYPWLYTDINNYDTGTSGLMDSLSDARSTFLYDDLENAIQGVAGFASLHTAITLLWALMAQYTIRNRLVHWLFWVNFGITIVATLYFGWHYVADDIGGVMIALISFYLGGLASGQKFDRQGRSSHPTTTTSKIPVDTVSRSSS